MLGRPDLMSNYGVMMAAPVTGTAGQVPASGGSFMGANLSTSVSGNVATGQLSLGMVATIIVFMMLFYWWTRSNQH
jgi:hypothetical protein